MEAALERARAAGYEALVVTIDTPVAGLRERDLRNGNSKLLGKSLLAKLPFLPGILAHPRWLWSFLRDGGVPKLPNIVIDGQPMELIDVGVALSDAVMTWDDLKWVRAAWPGPLIIKGVLTVEDARRCVASGAQGLVVSNHGGRQLDSSPATLRVLPAIAAAVGKQIEVLFDGGIRRGGDIVKALALGARAVLLGRAYGYGMASHGDAGVRRSRRSCSPIRPHPEAARLPLDRRARRFLSRAPRRFSPAADSAVDHSAMDLAPAPPLAPALLARFAALVGPDSCLSAPSDLLAYESDGLASFRARPGVVVLPRSTEEVAAVVKLAREAKLPIVPRGSGTGLSGGALPVPGCVLLGLSKMKRILELNLADGWMRVEPGVGSTSTSPSASRRWAITTRPTRPPNKCAASAATSRRTRAARTASSTASPPTISSACAASWETARSSISAAHYPICRDMTWYRRWWAAKARSASSPKSR